MHTWINCYKWWFSNSAISSTLISQNSTWRKKFPSSSIYLFIIMESWILTLFMGNSLLLSLFILMIIYCPRVSQWKFLQINCISVACQQHISFFEHSLLYGTIRCSKLIFYFSLPQSWDRSFHQRSFSKEWYLEIMIWL